MNLATLVSSLVLAASTATAGLLVAPSSPLSLPAAPQDGSGPSGPAVQVGPLCVGVCGNDTTPAGNSTADGNRTAPPPTPLQNQTAPPPSDNQTSPPAKTCGVDIDDSRDIEGPTTLAWSWEVGSGARNLTVQLQVDGAWSPLGGGARVALTDGDGRAVATSSTNGGSSLPFDYTVLSYQGDDTTGLSHGTWHLTVQADGYLGSAWLQVHSAC